MGCRLRRRRATGAVAPRWMRCLHKCALLSWRPPSVRSAVCARGHVRRMALVSQPSIRGHCSSGYLLERARVPADAAAVVVRRARVDAWVGDEVPMTLLRWRRVTAAAPTRCGRPLRGHASPCDAPVLASGATECRWRHYHRHRCPGRRARLPLGWLPSTPDSRVLPPPATEGHRRRGAEGGCTAWAKCALSSWQLLSTRSAM